MVCFQKTLYDNWYNKNVFSINRLSKKVTNFFQQNVSKTTLLNDEDENVQIHSNGKQSNHHAIDQTCVTYSSILGESSTKMTLDSQPFHSASSFQFPKDKCCNQEMLCQANWFWRFPWLHCDTRLVKFFGTGGATGKSSRKKLLQNTCDERTCFLVKFQVEFVLLYLTLTSSQVCLFCHNCVLSLIFFSTFKNSFFKSFLSIVASFCMWLVYQAKLNFSQKGAVSFIYVYKEELFFSDEHGN